MTDFEDRLRAAMAGAAEPPPAGLLDGIDRRHRRHVRRVTTACVAVVAFGLAGTLVTRGVLASPGGGGPAAGGPAAIGQAVVPSATPATTVTAAPGTVLRDCQSNNSGTLGSDWKAHSVQAGPVWFIYVRPGSTPSPSHRLATGRVDVNAMIIAVSNGRTAVVTAARALGGRFRFLAGVSAGQRSTLAQGAPGLTLAGCPAPGPQVARLPAIDAPGLTMFWEGYVTDLRGCISLQVRTSAASQPIRVTVAPAGGSCAS